MIEVAMLLYASLAGSLIAFVGVNVLFFSLNSRSSAFLVNLFSFFNCLCLMPIVILQCSLNMVAYLICRKRPNATSDFFWLTLGSMIVSNAIGLTWIGWKQFHYNELYRQTQFQSLEDRPALNPERIKENKYPTNTGEIESLESEIERKTARISQQLRLMHEGKMYEFVNNPGFGVSRMYHPTTLDFEEPNPPGMIFQPESPGTNDRIYDDLPIAERSIKRPLSGLHSDSMFDFINPKGFGYVKRSGVINSRMEVAGFRPHRFSKVPEATEWKVNSVELVGVLIHEEPRVYVSEYLPRMDQLSATKTRPLDAFEKEGLESITKGEDLFVRGKDSSARMMGAIRSAKQCVECHGGERGALLGAFSYRLVKRP